MGLFLAEFFHDLVRRIDGFVASFGTSLNKLAQVAHAAVAYGLVLTVFLAGKHHGAAWLGYVAAGIILGPWGIWKEAYRDPQPPENEPFWPNGLIDLSFYVLGSTLAIFAYRSWLR